MPKKSLKHKKVVTRNNSTTKTFYHYHRGGLRLGLASGEQPLGLQCRRKHSGVGHVQLHVRQHHRGLLRRGQGSGHVLWIQPLWRVRKKSVLWQL